MRFQNLYFPAFGPFTEHHLELDEKVSFHVVYGPNEAGKSSMLRGIRSLLYGVEERTGDNFQHSNIDLRVGAKLQHSDGQELSFFRRKGRSNTLLDAEGVTLDDNVLSAYLGGVDQSLFEQLYGLDHRTLVEGGRALLQSDGDIGQSLFAAGLGPEIRDLMRKLQTQAQDLWRERGQKYRLNRAVSEFREAQKEVSAKSLKPREWSDLNTELASLELTVEKYQDELAEARRQFHKLDRFEKAYPIVSSLRQHDRELSEIPVTPSLRADFRERRLELSTQHKSLQERLSRLLIKRRAAEDEIAEAGSHQPVLALAKTIEDLHRGLDSYLQSVHTLRETEDSLKRIQSQADALASDLSPGRNRRAITLPSAGSRRLAAALASEFATLQRDRLRQSQQLEKERGELQRCSNELQELGPEPALFQLEELDRELAGESKLDKEVEEATVRRRQAERHLQEALSHLAVFEGGVEELRQIRPLLPELLDRYEQGFEEIRQNHSEIKKELLRLAQENTELQAQRRELLGDTLLPTPAELLSSRSERDALAEILSQKWAAGVVWKQAQPHWSEFQESLVEADRLADRMFAEAERVTQIADVERRIEELQARDERQRAGLDTLMERRRELERQWQDQIPFEAGKAWSPKELRSWLQARQNILEQASELEQCDQALTKVCQKQSALLSKVGALLSLFQQPLDLSQSTLATASQAVARLLASQRKRSSRRLELAREGASLKQAITESQLMLSSLDSQLEPVQRQWKELLESLDVAVLTDPKDLTSLLELYEQLRDLRQKEDQLRITSEQSHKEQEVYRVRAVELAQELWGEGTWSAEKEVPRLYQTLLQARATESRRQSLQQQLQELIEETTNLQDETERVAGELKQLREEAQVESCEELDAVEERFYRRLYLEEECRRRREQLQPLCTAGTLEQFCEEVALLDPDSLPDMLSRALERVKELESRQGDLREKLGELRTQREQLISHQEGAATAASQAESAFVEAQELAEQYMVLTLSHHLLNRQLEEYRREHQGPILERAQAFFSQLTGGLYSRLEVGYDQKDNPILRACEGSRRKVGVEGLSDGTRDQLFLALRLATIEQQLSHHEPIPFVADDLLVHFDSQRARLALELLADFSEKTQVLLFTHLERDRDLAAELAPGRAQVHSLERALGGFQVGV